MGKQWRHTGLKKIRELSDFTVVNKNTDFKETSINFWESYSEFIDIDDDGFVETWENAMQQKKLYFDEQ